MGGKLTQVPAMGTRPAVKERATSTWGGAGGGGLDRGELVSLDRIYILLCWVSDPFPEIPPGIFCQDAQLSGGDTEQRGQLWPLSPQETVVQAHQGFVSGALQGSRPSPVSLGPACL